MKVGNQVQMKTFEETSPQIFVVFAWMAMLLTSNLTILLETKEFLMAWFITLDRDNNL